MKKLIVLLACLSLFFVCAFADEKGDAPKTEKTKVEVADIPKDVLDAAVAKAEGFEAKEAFVKADGEGKVYMIKGSVGEKKMVATVAVDKDGKVTKTEVVEKKEAHKKEAAK